MLRRVIAFDLVPTGPRNNPIASSNELLFG